MTDEGGIMLVYLYEVQQINARVQPRTNVWPGRWILRLLIFPRMLLSITN